MYYSIGEFSKLTNLTPKMLKLYQEKELLIPAKVDEFTKYRFYNDSNLETANLISFFKQFDLSLAEIKEIVDNQDDESVLAELLEKQKDVIEDKITKYNFVMGLINEKLKRRNTMTEINSASKQRSRFWKIFAKLLMSNVPIAESLEIAGKSADDEVKSIIKEIIEGVKQEKKLYELLNNNKPIFTRFEILVIYTGEESDKVEQSANRVIYSGESDKLAQAANKVGIHIEDVGLPCKAEGEKNTRSKYWKTFASLIESGIHIEQSLKEASEWGDENLRSVIDQMIEEIINGDGLSTTLKNRPETFTDLEFMMCHLGEIYGNLDKTIKQLPITIKMIEETEDENKKRKNFWREVGEFESTDFKENDKTMNEWKSKYLEELKKNGTDENIIQSYKDIEYHLFEYIIQFALYVADDKLKAISEDILKETADKKTLSSIMQKYPDIFQEFETRLIALGEKNGNVGKAALDIAEVL